MASCDSSRGHIGLTAPPGAGGGICACALVPSRMMVKNVAQATTDLEWVTIDFSGISRHQGTWGGHWAPPKAAVGTAGVINSAVLYPLLGAASRRFRGKSAVVPVFASVAPRIRTNAKQ